LLLAATVAPAQTAPVPSSPEQTLLNLTNAARAGQSLPPLQWDEALAQAAQAHAALLVEKNGLSHQFPGEAGLALRAAQAGAHFQAVAENIAIGGSPAAIQKEWMNSPPHRANILDPNLNAVGFAVLRKDGSLFAVADFAHAVPALTLDQVEATVGKLLLSQGVQPTGPSLDARQSCEMNSGTAGGSHPRFIARWQGSDLSRLPDSLERELKSGSYRTAAVGACASAGSDSGFTTYRVAVLLY
jgi:hypothetical protein